LSPLSSGGVIVLFLLIEFSFTKSALCARNRKAGVFLGNNHGLKSVPCLSGTIRFRVCPAKVLDSSDFSHPLVLPVATVQVLRPLLRRRCCFDQWLLAFPARCCGAAWRVRPPITWLSILQIQHFITGRCYIAKNVGP